MTPPLVSVVIGVRDGERYLGDALASVREQDFDGSIELIVVDDGSTDGTPDLLRRAEGPLRVITQPPSGLAAALNSGVEAATGTLLTFLDADDLMDPHKLAIQVPALLADSDLEAVFGHVSEFHSHDLTDAQRAPLAPPRENVPGYVKSGMLIRRESLLRVGPFDTLWTVGDFVDWYARALEAGLKVRLLPDVVVRRRLHAGNMSRAYPDARIDFTRIVRASLKRRRASGRAR